MAKKKIFSIKTILLLICLVGGAFLGFFDATVLGVNFFEEKVYEAEVDSQDDLLEMGGSFHNNVIKLTGDFLVDQKGGFASKEFPFVGTFDGQGHTIEFKDFRKTDDEGVESVEKYNVCRSFFGYIGKGGVVKNLTIKVSTADMKNKLGGIFALENEGKIVNCKVVVGKYTVMTKGIYGGLVGRNKGDVENVVCEVYFDKNIMAEEVESKQKLALGGLCAYNTGNVRSCIVKTTFNANQFEETQEKLVFEGKQYNNRIGGVYGPKSSVGKVEKTVCLIDTGVAVSDKDGAGITFERDASKVYNYFVLEELGFNVDEWKLEDNTFVLDMER